MNNTLTNARPVLFHLITGLQVGGAERMLSRVLPKLTDYTHVVISLRGNGPMGATYLQSGLVVETLDFRNPLDFKAVWKFRSLVKKYRPSILTTYLIHADLAGRLLGRLFGIPVIISSLRARFRKFEVRNILFFIKLFDSFVNHYIAVSEEVRRYYVEELHFPARKFTVVTNGLSAAEWQTSLPPNRRDQIVTSLGLPPSAKLIGTVSQLRPEKGVDRLIAGMGILKISRPDVHCLIIGAGPEQAKLEAQGRELGISQNLHFLGNRPDVEEIILVLDIFILPSLFEGMSNALLEAMASARPIIVTDTPENREVITDATGRLIDTSQPENMANVIINLLDHSEERFQLGLAARQRFEQHFNLDHKVEQLRRLYHQYLPRS